MRKNFEWIFGLLHSSYTQGTPLRIVLTPLKIHSHLLQADTPATPERNKPNWLRIERTLR